VVQDGENGFLVEPSRPDRLAEVTARLLASPETLQRCGAAARRTVDQRFSVRRMAREIEATYLEVASRYRDDR
jgi:glycosyltransferase involved in cell wall biosynthesis